MGNASLMEGNHAKSRRVDDYLVVHGPTILPVVLLSSLKSAPPDPKYVLLRPRGNVASF